jgi:hypothetical protein
MLLNMVYKTSSTFVPSFVPILVSFSYDDSEDENPPPPTHLPPTDSFEPEPAPAPLLPRWVCSIRKEVGDLVSDPSYQRQTRSQFQ